MTAEDAGQARDLFIRLANIVEELRQKCPWDRKQTKESLRHLTIEETYELADAIIQDDAAAMKEELGDLLLHILFYASLAREQGLFSLEEMIQAQIDKLIRRHPHVYGDQQGASEAQIRANWEQIKAAEKAQRGHKAKTVLEGVPHSLPALIKAYRIQEKAASVGFDWEDAAKVWDKVKEEILEFELAGDARQREDEMGDLLFALVNYCRHAGINPDDALARTNEKFRRRFEYIERQAHEKGEKLSDMPLQQMEDHWQQAKTEEE
ncbi:MAG: nucleoside triphosphate pyrophosphohydrolase [Bacteroidetes bacterium]|nr:MAG: nucleoside triphosphate pyrophosphohydrolase [Bacteroidota bacterium]